MASASTRSTVAYIYKTVYSGKAPADISMKKHPFFRDVKKQTDFSGDSFTFSMKTGNAQGISAIFATAQTNAAPSKGAKFALTTVDKFGNITIDEKALKLAKGKGAIMDLVTTESNAIFGGMGDAIAFDLYRSTSGMRGRRSSASGNIVTLTDANDVRNFARGMTISAASVITGASGNRSGNAIVTSIDEDGGTVTFDDVSDIGTFSDNDYLFIEDDETACAQGLAAWLPLTAPSASESFFGVDRTVDMRALAGIRLDDTSLYPEEAVKVVCDRISMKSTVGTPDRVYMNPVNFTNMVTRTQAQVVYDDDGGERKIGAEYITIATSCGMVRVHPDPDCPLNRGYVLDMEHCYVKSADDVPHITDTDSLQMLRQGTSNGVEQRVAAYYNFYTDCAGASGVFSIAT